MMAASLSSEIPCYRDAMAAGTIRLEPLITHRVPLDRAAEALTMMRDQSEFYAKVLIDPAAREHRT